MPPVARRHHFLPQGYLAGFTDTGRKDGRLQVLDVKTGRPFQTSPLNVALEKDFKRVDIDGHPPDVIESALAPIEERAALAIRRVTVSEAFPSDDDYNHILNLLSLGLSQNPKSRRALNNARTREIHEKHDVLVATEANWNKHLARAREAGEELRGDLSYQRARRFVEERRYSIAFDNFGTLLREFEAQDELLSALAKRTWTVLITPSDGPHFICSDYPYALTMEHGVRGTPRFLGNNTELFFPLSKTAGFMGVLGNPLKPVVRVAPKAVAIMNRRIMRKADRHLYVAGSRFITFEGSGIIEVSVGGDRVGKASAAR